MSQTRRHFLKRAFAVSAGFAGLRMATEMGGFSLLQMAEAGSAGYGPLQPDPDGLLDLPQGFRYHVFSTAGETMDDGFQVPGLHDGMAAFPGPDGMTVLVRNHELYLTHESMGAFANLDRGTIKRMADKLYDPGTKTMCPGGTTTLVYDVKNRQLVKHSLSLTGTLRNCSGGPTPWNTWITCEEIVVPKSKKFTKPHGYNFEVPASGEIGLAAPVPLTAMGCFEHEAVAVDPETGIAYQTEDKNEGLIYRFLPNTPGRFLDGGRLQALVLKDEPGADTRNWGQGDQIVVGTQHPVRWIDLENVDLPAEDDLRHRGFKKGAARFARGEGMWYGNRSVYFTCTKGGEAKKGQVWRYTPSLKEGTVDETDAPAALELVLEPNDGNIVDKCDNLTVTPWGDLFLCEDGPGEQFVVGVTPEGGTYRIARNAGDQVEFAGGTFSPEGSTFFVNIQSGKTLAITGPWKSKSHG